MCIKVFTCRSLLDFCNTAKTSAPFLFLLTLRIGVCPFRSMSFQFFMIIAITSCWKTFFSAHITTRKNFHNYLSAAEIATEENYLKARQKKSWNQFKCCIAMVPFLLRQKGHFNFLKIGYTEMKYWWIFINHVLTHTHPHLHKIAYTHPHPAKKRSHSPTSSQKNVTHTHTQPKKGHTHLQSSIPSQKKVHIHSHLSKKGHTHLTATCQKNVHIHLNLAVYLWIRKVFIIH